MKRFCLIVVISLAANITAHAKNGFDLRQHSIPLHEIHHGGPPKDGIPAIDSPVFLVESNIEGTIRDDSRVLGISRNGVAKAYPISIMNWHEVVNDDFAGEAVLVSYCPLCGTGMAFLAENAGHRLSFGVSGLLYQNDVLLYDRKTQSLWSQIMGQAVTGPMTGTKLQQIVMEHTTWSAWKKAHPDSLLLSKNTAYSRDYETDPYAGYASSRRVIFDMPDKAPPPYHPKELVLGVQLTNANKVYPFSELSKTAKTKFSDIVEGVRYTIEWDAKSRTARIRNTEGTLLPSTIAYWFAWHAFFPDSIVYRAKP